MRKLKSIVSITACGFPICTVFSLCACGTNDLPINQQLAEITVDNAKIVVWGYEWGPAVPKVIVKFSGAVSGVTKDTFDIRAGSTNRELTDVYLCDENGNKTTESTEYVAFEMSVKYNEASPFAYNQAKNLNDWATRYNVILNVKNEFTVGGNACEKETQFTYKTTVADRLIPQTQSWEKDTFTHGEYTLQRASWTPNGAKSDAGKNPLIIWLHGMGEGGTDIDIALLGNEVTALTTENTTNIQHYFTSDSQKGAYVLAVQTPTFWMDSGDDKVWLGTSDGKQSSIYTEALFAAIDDYVKNNSDIDSNRIYIGGCSNGGYMPMVMMFEHGDYFAAFYPICEAYADENISDDVIRLNKGRKIWFVQSEADTTVDRNKFVIPTYMRLLEAGAQDVHFTLFDKVRGIDDPNPSTWDTGFYDGHWVWIYAFNDQIKTQFDNSQLITKEDYTSEKCTAVGNMWQWLSQQSK